mmetsp:Transcript_37939/g.108771  ORF Transcript_37939/g.108771 Transcript_37939/m.108771 type:complete len:218 (+) Transcript_37939:484-1137(+)
MATLPNMLLASQSWLCGAWTWSSRRTFARWRSRRVWFLIGWTRRSLAAARRRTTTTTATTASTAISIPTARAATPRPAGWTRRILAAVRRLATSTTTTAMSEFSRPTARSMASTPRTSPRTTAATTTWAKAKAWARASSRCRRSSTLGSGSWRAPSFTSPLRCCALNRGSCIPGTAPAPLGGRRAGCDAGWTMCSGPCLLQRSRSPHCCWNTRPSPR